MLRMGESLKILKVPFLAVIMIIIIEIIILEEIIMGVVIKIKADLICWGLMMI